MASKALKITQVRSGIGFDKKQTLALRGLGLRRIRHTVEVADTPAIRGLILKVRHLVDVVDGLDEVVQRRRVALGEVQQAASHVHWSVLVHHAAQVGCLCSCS